MVTQKSITPILPPPFLFLSGGYKGVIPFFVTIFERALDGYTKIYHPHTTPPPFLFLSGGYKGVIPFFVTIFAPRIQGSA